MPSNQLSDLETLLSTPLYRGSVQNLYQHANDESQLISETTSGGSVFDVGTIYQIAGSDTARTCFRHFVFMALANPETWKNARQHILANEQFKGSRMTALVDELCVNGANTHHIGMLDRKSGTVLSDAFPDSPSNLTLIENFRINKPERIHYAGSSFYDYSSYPNLDSFVIPLEYIVRFGVTSGSSILSIYNALKGTEKIKYLNELGQTEPLTPWSTFHSSINDFTTKYEPSDRSISKQEAALISGISGAQFVNSIMLSQLASYLVKTIFHSMGLELWDLKWEIAKKGESLVFVDTIDTDSVRATLKIENEQESCFVHFNKQAMRDYYKIMHSEWYAALNDAKSLATTRNEPFMEILTKGQNAETYPRTPVADPEFLCIQEQKFNYINRFVLQNGKVSDAKAQTKIIAQQEIKYYADAGKLKHFLRLNGC